MPAGKLSEAKVIPSSVFPGTQHTYWVYVPAQYGGAIFPEMMRWLWRDQPVSTDPEDREERSFRNPKQPATEATPPADR